jgi:hypothetical protein
MNRFSILFAALLMTVLLMTARPAKAQVDPTIDCWIEMARLREFFTDTITQYYDIIYISQRTDSARTTYDTVIANVAQGGGWDGYLTDSAVCVQKGLFNFTHYISPKQVILGPLMDFSRFAFLYYPGDAAFYRQFVDSATIMDTGSLRKLSFHFKPEAPFKSYYVLYDTADYVIHTLRYELQHTEYGADPLPYTPGEVMTIHISFDVTFPPELWPYIFSTPENFIVKQNGQYVLLPLLDDYELLNFLNQ